MTVSLLPLPHPSTDVQQSYCLTGNCKCVVAGGEFSEDLPERVFMCAERQRLKAEGLTGERQEPMFVCYLCLDGG